MTTSRASIFRPSDFRCPLPWEDAPDSDVRRTGWLKEMLQEGNNFLKMQRAYPMFDKALDVIGGIEDEPIPQSLSDIYSNRLKRQAREVVATLANLKPIWTYKSDNPLFETASINLNKVGAAWWHQTFADQKIKKALQWSMVSTGYVMPIWDRNYWSYGRGDIDLQIYGPRDVIPIGMGKDHDLQRAYGTIICTEVPLSQAYAIYPKFADKLQASRNQPSWFNGMMSRMKKITSRFPRHILDIVGAQKEDSSPSGPTIDIYHVYISDTTINRTNKPIRMGKPGTSWYYEVPYLGQAILDNTGAEPKSRLATEDDCRLYPLRRLMIATDTIVLQDDTSPWWHGRVPLAKFTIDEWPDQFLGYSIINDAYTIQKAMNQNLRSYQDYVSKMLRPDVTYDPEGRAKSEIKRYDPRVPGQKIPVNPQMGDTIGFVEMPPLPQDVLAYHEVLKQEMDHLMAIPDMKDLARANQVPSQDTLEKLMEIAGPVVQDMSRSLEKSMQDLGEMVKTLIYQFYPPVRKVSLLGQDGFTPEDFLFRKDNIIPMGYKDGAWEHEPSPTWLIPDNMEKAYRARNGCIFHIMPGSLHQITQTQYKMFLLQFWRDGRFPIDPQTVAEGFNMTNFGQLPGNAQTILQRWEIWQKIMLQFQVQAMQAQGVAQLQLQQAAQMQQLGQEIDQLGGAIANGMAGQGNEQEGRPPSGQVPPHEEVRKDETGAPRPVVSESR